ncbi:MAG: hypothetical protein V7631_3483 [Massilia sp.]|jgi:predicted DNA-binding protein (MmcQ/YjbR family)
MQYRPAHERTCDALRIRPVPLPHLPGVTEDTKWDNDLVFSVGDKMFAVTNLGEATGMRFKVDDDRFLELTDRPGIIPAPYLARAKWVYVEDAQALGDEEAAQLLRRSYELVFGKLPTLRQTLRAEDPTRKRQPPQAITTTAPCRPPADPPASPSSAHR